MGDHSPPLALITGRLNRLDTDPPQPNARRPARVTRGRYSKDHRSFWPCEPARLSRARTCCSKTGRGEDETTPTGGGLGLEPPLPNTDAPPPRRMAYFAEYRLVLTPRIG